MKLQKTSRTLSCLSLYLRSSITWQGLSVFLVEVAGVLGLFSPHNIMEVDDGGQDVEDGIQGKLDQLRW